MITSRIKSNCNRLIYQLMNERNVRIGLNLATETYIVGRNEAFPSSPQVNKLRPNANLDILKHTIELLLGHPLVDFANGIFSNS